MKYEAHITVEPRDNEIVYDKDFILYEDFAERSKENGWRASMFEHDDVDGIAGKWFISRSSDDLTALHAELQGMVHGVSCSGFTVLRWKLEMTLADSKDGDDIDELKRLGPFVYCDFQELGAEARRRGWRLSRTEDDPATRAKIAAMEASMSRCTCGESKGPCPKHEGKTDG